MEITEASILQILATRTEPVTAKAISQALVGKEGNSKHANPMLYRMLARGSVVVMKTTPPRWSLAVPVQASEYDQLLNEIHGLLDDLSMDDLLAIKAQLAEKK